MDLREMARSDRPFDVEFGPFVGRCAPSRPPLWLIPTAILSYLAWTAYAVSILRSDWSQVRMVAANIVLGFWILTPPLGCSPFRTQ